VLAEMLINPSGWGCSVRAEENALFCKSAYLAFSVAKVGYRIHRVFLGGKWKRMFDITDSFHGSKLHVIIEC